MNVTGLLRYRYENARYRWLEIKHKIKTTLTIWTERKSAKMKDAISKSLDQDLYSAPIFAGETPSDPETIYDLLQYPQAHCDNRILHSPGYCKWCDGYPEAQQLRAKYNVEYTDDDPGSKSYPCPAVQSRGQEALLKWAGNAPAGPGVPQSDRRKIVRSESVSSQVFYGIDYSERFDDNS